jgi:beta-barrel assembly-enhancing protease
MRIGKIPFIFQKNISLWFIAYSLWLFSGCVTTEYNVGSRTQDLILFSSEREVSMGRNIHRKIAQEFKLSQNPYDLERLELITQKLLQVVDREELAYYFYIIEEDDRGKNEINAFSLPGGYCYIFKDLLDLLDDDELAFVLAHEMAHVVSRHHVKRLQAAMGYNLLVVASTQAQAEPGFTQGVSFALAQIMVAHSREDELNADELAVKYTKAAGFNPAAGISLLEKIHDESRKKISPLSYFRTHPYQAQRVRRIKEVLRLPLAVDDYIN